LEKVDIDDIQNHLEMLLPGALELLRQMVSINSFTTNLVGVHDVAEQTAAAFAPLGFTAEYIQATDDRYGQHLVLTNRGTGPRTIGFISHLDTVYPAEEEILNDFYWREELVDDEVRLYGPGTVDIKGGTVMMYMMLATLQAKFPELYNQVTWVLFLNAAEETFVEDFREICKARLPQRDTVACLVFEGGRRVDGDDQLVVARKGMARYVITVQGRASHAGVAHEMGANAIVQMAEIVQRIHALTDYQRRLTFNVGVLHAGTVVNRVPHLAQAEIEFRTYDEEVFAEALISMRSLDGFSTVNSPADQFACQTHVVKTHENRPWPRNTGTDRLFFVWQEVARELGREVWPEDRGGLSDGNPLWAYVPTLDGLGPVGNNSHCSERSPDGSKDQEYVLKDSFVPKALLNIMALVRLLEGSA
jgi:glutamate carboxypeptidase